MSIRIGDRIRDDRGETGVVVETGIAMRDASGYRRLAVKVDLDPTERYPRGLAGAFRYVDRVTCEPGREGVTTWVGRIDGTMPVETFATLEAGEARIAELEREDPEGVERGDYYVDATEEESERAALRREARQEAMLDAGPILAEYRRAKGE